MSHLSINVKKHLFCISRGNFFITLQQNQRTNIQLLYGKIQRIDKDTPFHAKIHTREIDRGTAQYHFARGIDVAQQQGYTLLAVCGCAG